MEIIQYKKTTKTQNFAEVYAKPIASKHQDKHPNYPSFLDSTSPFNAGKKEQEEWMQLRSCVRISDKYSSEIQDLRNKRVITSPCHNTKHYPSAGSVHFVKFSYCYMKV